MPPLEWSDRGCPQPQRAENVGSAAVEDSRVPQIALITGPGIPPSGLWAFDISYVDDQSQTYYLADASNASVDLVDTRNNTFIG